MLDHAGANNPNSKVTMPIVREIRRKSAFDGATLRELSDYSGLSRTQCSSIVNGKSWREED